MTHLERELGVSLPRVDDTCTQEIVMSDPNPEAMEAAEQLDMQLVVHDGERQTECIARALEAYRQKHVPKPSVDAMEAAKAILASLPTTVWEGAETYVAGVVQAHAETYLRERVRAAVAKVPESPYDDGHGHGYNTCWRRFAAALGHEQENER